MLSKARIRSHPMHPMLVAFPLGLWITSFILDLIGRGTGNQLYYTGSFFMIVGGCIGAALAAVPGVVDLFGVVPPKSSAKSRGYFHGALNTLALALFIWTAARRGGPDYGPDNIAILVSLAGVIIVLFSGWMGATLVYRNQIGVDHRYANAGKFKERNIENWDRPVCNQGELGDGQMMLVHIDGERIVIGRCEEGVFAFSDHCTHRGGPLSDGALVSCTVQCPWHGSQFDLRTGRVVAGPAKEKIGVYRTEIRGGEVYIKRVIPERDKRVA